MGTTKKCQCGEYKNRPVAVDAVIIRDKNILLQKRAVEPEKNKWALPGGHIDWDESAEAAVRREVQEEVGLDVTGAKLIGVQSNTQRLRQIIAITFLVEANGEPRAESETSAVRWFPLDSLPENLAFDHNEIINKAVKQSRY